MSISSFRSLIIMSLTGLTIWTSPLPLFAEDEAIAPLTVELGRDVNFDDDISPILKANCLACHNGLKKEGSLNLETVAGMLAGGDSGTSLVPGKADESYLFKVAARQEEPLMPPLPNKMNAHKLTGQEVWKLQQWINAGAIPGQKSAQSAIVWNSTLNRLQPVYALSLIPGESLVAVGRGPFLELLSLNRPDQSVQLIDPNLQSSAHRDFVNAITAHPSGRILASAGFRSVKIWEQPEIAELAAAQSAAPVAAWTTLVIRAGVASIDTAGQLTLLLPEASNTFSTNELEVKAVAIKSDSSEVAVIRKEGNEVAVIKLTGPPTPVVFAVPVPATHICYQEAQLVTAHQDGSIRVWDAAADGTTWAVNGAEFRVDNQPFQQFSLTSERELLTCSSSGEVVLWDLAKRAPAKKWNAGADVTGCETAPLGERFATLHQNGAVRIWDAQGKKLHEWQSSGQALLSISGVERRIAIAKSLSTYAQAQEKASDTDVQERTKSVETAKENIKKAEEALEKAKAPAEEAQKALTDAETKLAAEPENDGLKKAKEEAAKKQESAQQTLKEAETTLERAKTTLGLEEQALKRSQEKLQERVASAKTRAEDVTKLEADLKTQRDALGQNKLDCIGFSFADPVCIRVLTRTGRAELWNCQTGLPVSVSVNPVWSGVNRVQALVTDTLATVTDDNRLRILNCNPAWQLKMHLEPDQAIQDLSQSPFVDRVTALAFSHDGKLLATGGGDPSRAGELMIWDWEKRTVIKSLPEAHSDTVTAIKFSDNDQFLATASADKFVKCFNVQTGELVNAFEGHTEHVLDVAWSADGLSLASASADKTVKIWDAIEGAQKRTITSFEKQVTGLKYIGVSDNLATCSGDKVVRLFQASNGRNYRNMTGAEKFVNAFDVTDSESLVIAGDHSGTVRLWNGQNGQLLQTYVPKTETAPQ